MRRILILAGIALVACALPLGADDEGGWLWEAGLLGGYHDNFFYRGDGGAQPSSNLFQGYFTGELERDTGPADVTVAFGGSAVKVADIEDADYQSIGATAAYKRGRSKIQGSFGLTLNRLYSEEGEAVFFDEQSLDVWYRYSVGPRLWLRARVELEQWDFDPAENDRDADVVKLALTARYALSDRAGLRLSLLGEDRDAAGARNNRTGKGWALALEARPTEEVDLFLRFRSRDRDYEDAPPGDRNFRRSDTTEDINLNLRWRVTERWGAQLRNTYRSGESTRPDRNFSGNQIEVGAFVRF